MIDEDYTEFWNSVDFTFIPNHEEYNYELTVSFPDTVDIGAYSLTGHTVESLAHDAVDLVSIVYKNGTVNDDMTTRGEKANELIPQADGVHSTSHSDVANTVQVRHTSFQTDTYDTVKYVTGLEQNGWWLSFDYEEKQILLTVEYRINRFTAPLPEEKSWDDLEEHLVNKEYTTYAHDSFERPFNLRQEWEEHAGEIVRDDDISEYPRLAGTENTVVHAYYMHIVRNGDVDDLAKHIFTTLDPDEIGFMAHWAKENVEEEAKQYSVDKYYRMRNEEGTIEDIPDWEPNIRLPKSSPEEFFTLEGEEYINEDSEE